MPDPKAKKWAKKARTILVHLEGRNGADLGGIHVVEILDAKKHTLRKRTVEYRDVRPALSAIMTDVQARLVKNSLIIDTDSYEFANDGRTLRATVSVSSGTIPRRAGL